MLELVELGNQSHKMLPVRMRIQVGLRFPLLSQHQLTGLVGSLQQFVADAATLLTGLPNKFVIDPEYFVHILWILWAYRASYHHPDR